MKNKILYLYHDIFLQHETMDHPEHKDRLIAINEKVDQLTELIEKKTPQKATIKEVGEVHDPKYINRVADTIKKKFLFLDSMDTVISAQSLEAAYHAVGAGITACDQIMNGNFKRAFCAVRPPGHHAEYDQAMGFCIFNNIAIAAKYLQKNHGIKKVLILDFDVHHGNGTESCFYQDDSVYYISTHQYPNFPGTGSPEDIGEEKGKGYNLNIIFPAGTGDKEYLNRFKEQVIPVINKFAPEIILLSSGFDAHQKDPLAGLNLSSDCFGQITKLVVDNSESASGRIISFLEGGYDLDALSDSVVHHLKALAK